VIAVLTPEGWSLFPREGKVEASGILDVKADEDSDFFLETGTW
jgi:hypothetical protein